LFAKGVRLLADTQPSTDIGHSRALPKVHVSLPKQAHDLLCTASLLHLRTLSSPTRGTRILSQDLAQDLGRGSVVAVDCMDDEAIRAAFSPEKPGKSGGMRNRE
jgi:hypothetical protein